MSAIERTELTSTSKFPLHSEGLEPRRPRILVVDDEKLIRWSIEAELTERGYETVAVEDGRSALAKVEGGGIDAVILDFRLPDYDGVDLIETIHQRDAALPVVMLTAHSSVGHAVEAMRRGAYHYVAKPFDAEELANVVADAIRHRARSGSDGVGAGADVFGDLLGTSPPMEELRAVLGRVAKGPATTILLLGESGTGKELAARAIHTASARANGPFLSVRCTALTPEVLEGELFGHEPSAGGSNGHDKPGLLESADGGTLFLDEIGDLDPRIQAKLLRFLETRSFRRVGGIEDVRPNVRLIVSTHVDLQEAVSRHTFRRDLYFRLSGMTVKMPALRERVEDIPLLVTHFLARACERIGRPVPELAPEVIKRMIDHPWPGNVRQLESAVERAVVTAEGAILDVHDFPVLDPTTESDPMTLPSGGVDIDAVERSLLRQALERTRGNRTRAARLLGLTRNQIRYRIQKFGLDDVGGPELD